jgi:hypothetical protein
MTYNKPVCNCPDGAAQELKNLYSNYQSRLFDRNWRVRTTSTGSVDFHGIRDRGYYCKHENCVIIIRGEIDDAYPSGIPYEPPIRPLPPDEKSLFPIDSDDLYIKPIGDIEL